MSDEQARENGVSDAADERRKRFGALPDRISPSERVESTETDPPRGTPESAVDEREWPLRWGSGG